MHYLEEVKKWLGEITEILLLLIAIGIAIEILFGTAVPQYGKHLSLRECVDGYMQNLGARVASTTVGGARARAHTWQQRAETFRRAFLA